MNPGGLGRTVRVQTKVFFGVPSIDRKPCGLRAEYSSCNYIELRVAFMQPSDLNQPIGVILICCCVEVNDFGWFLNGPLA